VLRRLSVWRFGHPVTNSNTLASLTLNCALYWSLSVWRFGHLLPISIKLASVMFLEDLRSSDWRLGHLLATSNTLASVLLHIYSTSDRKLGHRFTTSNTLKSVMSWPEKVCLFSCSCQDLCDSTVNSYE